MNSTFKRNYRRALVAALALSLFPMLAHASESLPEEVTGKFLSLGARGTYIDPNDSDEGRWFVGAQGRVHIGPVLAVEGAVDYRSNTFGTDTTIRTYPVTASLMAYLVPHYRISPYILGGGGWYYTQVEGPGGFSNTQNRVGVHAGAGLEFKINEYLSIDGSYRYVWLESVTSKNRAIQDKSYKDSGPMYTAGLNFHFF